MRRTIATKTSNPRFSALPILLATATSLTLFASNGCGSGGHTIPVAKPSGLAAEYVATDIGTPSGYTLDFAASVNNSGQVVSNWTRSGERSHGFIYTPGSGFIDVGTLADAGQNDNVYLYGINNIGQAVGYVDSSLMRSFLCSNGMTRDLSGFLPTNGKALGINDSGKIVGYGDKTISADPIGPISNAFAYADSGGTQDIGALIPNEINCYALAVNNSGLVIGYCNLYNKSAYGPGQLFEYANGKVTTLAPLNYQYDSLAAVNSSGQITGTLRSSNLNVSLAHAFFYANGSPQDIGTLGGLGSGGLGISDGGVVVGYSDIDETNTAAFAWYNGKMTNLNTITTGLNGFTLAGADGISSSGVIVADGQDSSGVSHVFVLRPVVDSKKVIVRSAGLRLGVPRRAGGVSREQAMHSLPHHPRQ